ncbi:substrate-binding domain-containing protein [Thermopolyspora sp. NPDC052614]|uniref:sugar ABC transporter substrate-binding protein n=1 Tax=Thermopolyspora sp. NPDC052614 TaxID=3155682 RepID=UPI00342759FD
MKPVQVLVRNLPTAKAPTGRMLVESGELTKPGKVTRAKNVVRPTLLGAVLATAALAAAACGSPSGAVGDGASASGAGINVAQAKKDLDAIIAEPGEISVPAIGKAIPKGKTISYMTCPVAVCTEVGRGVEEAAKTLGWSVRIVQNNATPIGYKNAWDQVAQNPGDGVINAGPVLPYSAVESQMATAGVPVISSTSPSPVGGYLKAVIASTDDVRRQGEAVGHWVVQDAGAPVTSVFIHDPSIPALASALPGYRDAVKKNCPACDVVDLKVSAAQIGPALAQQVVSYLQSNPDVKYAAFGLGDLATGVPAAIKAAGLSDQVKVTTRAATPANLEDVKNGGMAVAFTGELYESGWRAVDKLARVLSGAPIGDTYPLGLVRAITKDNLPSDLTVPYSIPGYEASFKKAWNVS